MRSFTTHDGRNLVWPFSSIEPRDVQLAGLSKGFGKPGFAYFMRQRTGKTWTAFAEFTILKKMGLCKWMVIICPNSLKEQWYSAIEQADMFIPICVHESQNKRKTQHFFKNAKSGVFIINYESVQAYSRTMDVMLDTLGFDPTTTYIVADESTKIKEPDAKCTKACVKISNLCKFKRVLTGRPTANNNTDIWAQLKFIGETKRNFFQHKFTFCIMGGFQGQQVVKNINVELLQSELDPISYIAEDKYIRGFKKTYEPMRRVNLAGRLADMYKKMQDELIFGLNDDLNITAPIVLVKYLRLQQIGSGIAGDPTGMQHNLIEPKDNPRIRAVKDILDQETENKVIIVCRFRLSIKNLYEELTSDGHKVCVLNGNMQGKQVEDMKQKFNDTDDHNIMIAQTSVLSFGHTLCGKDDKPCDTMIFFENDFSLINRAQCESRPEKYGRDVSISYFDLFASKMDKYMLQKLIDKEEASLTLMKYAREQGMRPQGFADKDNNLVDAEAIL